VTTGGKVTFSPVPVVVSGRLVEQVSPEFDKGVISTGVAKGGDGTVSAFAHRLAMPFIFGDSTAETNCIVIFSTTVVAETVRGSVTFSKVSSRSERPASDSEFSVSDLMTTFGATGALFLFLVKLRLGANFIVLRLVAILILDFNCLSFKKWPAQYL